MSRRLISERAGGTPRLRFPERERRLRKGARGTRHRFHWSASQRDRLDGIKVVCVPSKAQCRKHPDLYLPRQRIERCKSPLVLLSLFEYPNSSSDSITDHASRLTDHAQCWCSLCTWLASLFLHFLLARPFVPPPRSRQDRLPCSNQSRLGRRRKRNEDC